MRFEAAFHPASVLEEKSDDPDQPKPGQEREEMDDLAPGFVVVLDLGNQIGGSDVDEIARGER
jgi:hypothetical protein